MCVRALKARLTHYTYGLMYLRIRRRLRRIALGEGGHGDPPLQHSAFIRSKAIQHVNRWHRITVIP